ncbi:MAG: DUF1826 domain-containing protein [Alphaproteobacteria bacterium]|nr:DUF1826 domain-containing protein [Alphaproteobacteria bacterium]
MNVCLPPAAVTVRTLAQLTRLHEPDVHLVVLERPFDPALTRAAWSLPTDTRLVLRGRPDALADALRGHLAAEQEPLATDVARWSAVLADLLGAEALGLRLTATDRPTCPAFHVDRVDVRLITTWAGAGTEFLAEADVDRRWLGYAGRGESLGETGLIRPGARPRQLPPQAVGLFKGERWPGNEGRGVVHRSPPVPAGSRRVLLTLDVLA